MLLFTFVISCFESLLEIFKQLDFSFLYECSYKHINMNVFCYDFGIVDFITYLNVMQCCYILYKFYIIILVLFVPHIIFSYACSYIFM